MDANRNLGIHTAMQYCFNPRARDGREFQYKRYRHYLVRFNPRARDGRENI